MQRIRVNTALQFPYYPPRPTSGPPLTAESSKRIIERLSECYVIQPKLNGDRVMCLRKDGKTHLANRHGGFYSFSLTPAAYAALSKLPDGTLLDGEVKDKDYLPFEAVVVGGEDLRRACPSVRVARAKEVAQQFGLRWLFDTPTQEWVNKLTANAPAWEGFVAKRRGTNYAPLFSDSQHSATWLKYKW